MKLSEIGEFGLINKITKAISYSSNVIKGIGDDAAVLESTNENNFLLITNDMLVEDVHFSFNYSSPLEIGYKALAVNISDIAAMGGQPSHCTIAIAIPQNTNVEIIEGIYNGLNEIAKEYNINIVGGDTVKSTGPLVISITLLGEVEKANVKYRSGAKVDDLIGITGHLGGSAAGLKVLSLQNKNNRIFNKLSKEAIKRAIFSHIKPIPQIRSGNLLAQYNKVTTMNDVSDGLASELHEISSASNTGFIIYSENIPIENTTKEIALANNIDYLEWPLYGGEDYKLVFTCNPNIKEEIKTKFKKEGLEVFFIGKVVEDGIFKLIDEEGKESEIYPKGYNHFI